MITSITSETDTRPGRGSVRPAGEITEMARWINYVDAEPCLKLDRHVRSIDLNWPNASIT